MGVNNVRDYEKEARIAEDYMAKDEAGSFIYTVEEVARRSDINVPRLYFLMNRMGLPRRAKHDNKAKD